MRFSFDACLPTTGAAAMAALSLCSACTDVGRAQETAVLPAPVRDTDPKRESLAPPVAGPAVVDAVITDPGAPCPQARDSSGRDFSIQSGLPHTVFATGARLRLTGRWIDFSVCQQGPTLMVDTAEPVPDP